MKGLLVIVLLLFMVMFGAANLEARHKPTATRKPTLTLTPSRTNTPTATRIPPTRTPTPLPHCTVVKRYTDAWGNPVVEWSCYSWDTSRHWSMIVPPTITPYPH